MPPALSPGSCFRATVVLFLDARRFLSSLFDVCVSIVYDSRSLPIRNTFILLDINPFRPGCRLFLHWYRYGRHSRQIIPCNPRYRVLRPLARL